MYDLLYKHGPSPSAPMGGTTTPFLRSKFEVLPILKNRPKREPTCEAEFHFFKKVKKSLIYQWRKSQR